MKKDVKQVLISKGVWMPNPESVFVSDDVDADRVAGQGVKIWGGCKLTGPKTLILPGVELGREASVTLDNCRVGENTKLKGGFFQGAVFMGGNEFGSGAHVRSGTILEEQANAAHTVGLKQTILFPFVTLGSLINFCDCFMAGGTSRKDHSEVGSSFIHFNYTPNQDKATPSMMGNVHQGVMLDQSPIFLGGQGGIAGPVRIGYGCVTAAGSVVRRDEERPDRLILGGGLKSVSLPRQPKVYTQVTRVFNLNIRYIAALIALRYWYAYVRSLFGRDKWSEQLVMGLRQNLDTCIAERIKRLTDFCEKVIISKAQLLRAAKPSDTALQAHDRAIEKLKTAIEIFETAMADAGTDSGLLDPDGRIFVEKMAAIAESGTAGYIGAVQALPPDLRARGSRWLETIENNLTRQLTI